MYGGPGLTRTPGVSGIPITMGQQSVAWRPFIFGGATFGGSANLIRSSDFTGNADGKTGTLSCWVRIDGGDGGFRYIYNAGRFDFYVNAGNQFQVLGKQNTGSTTRLNFTSSAYAAGTTWRHVLASWNLATAGTGRLYVNDADDKTENVYTDATIDYTRATHTIGGDTSEAQRFNGVIAEFWFAPNTYIDFNVADCSSTPTASRRIWA